MAAKIRGHLTSIDYCEDHTMRKLSILSLMAAALVLAGCNTIEGVGRDVSAAGQAVASSAKSARS